ncbi:hypothetical protein [Sulfuricystis multivorans]|uniref:hypothetical protein n=1 Tax=Sulfuricystis multivorans TaxID=2211108 RepID=UPI000F823006|nr:hypothetical protein [Sulfuricystis multivorans]
MHKARLLAALNRQLLETYSRRTTAAISARLPLPAALPWLDRLLASNVAKEVRKDAEVIHSAARAAVHQQAIDDAEVERLLRVAAAIDRDFLMTARGPLEIPIPYERINPVRRARIRRLFEAVQRVCAAWPTGRGLREALAAAYPGDALERLVADLLLSYAQETRILGEAVRMPALLMPLRQRVLSGLYATMEKTALALAREAASLSRPKAFPRPI